MVTNDQPLGLKAEAEEEEEEDNACWASYGRGRVRRFPPAMPLLARTGNLSCHMPWELERTYRTDGSLVIREVRVRHHHYFRARRDNGRLQLRLVELHDNSPLFRENNIIASTTTADDDQKTAVSRTCAAVSPLQHRSMSSIRAAVHA